jgi:hypothetical protein
VICSFLFGSVSWWLVTVLLFRRCGFGCSERIHLLFVWLLAAAVRFSVCVWCSVFLVLWICCFVCCFFVVDPVVFRVSVLLPVLCVVFRFMSCVCFLMC